MKRYLPFLFGLFAGMFIYSVLTPDLTLDDRQATEQMQRLHEVMQNVRNYYVEEIDPAILVDGAIRGMLETLDPHTTYIPQQLIEDLTERFEGHFEGIGVEFIIQDSYPLIVSPIPDSPSDRLGLHAGDKIVMIENESTFQMSSDEIMNRLRGERGTVVEISIQREASDSLLSFSIRRDKIALNSIIAAFMLNEKTGFIKLTHFAKTTDDEMKEALTKLEKKGMQQLILDLRGNSGGYLEQAVAVADKFIPSGKKIVDTRGRIGQANEEYFASDDPAKTVIPLIILMSHGSASASEIVAGAIQDWDRGLVIGERSFGKGLVQSQIGLRDGSAVRVTIARYYTPSGRPIQRPFQMSRDEYYENAFATADSTTESAGTREKFYTENGRTVFGNGGISPDIKIVWEIQQNNLLNTLLRHRLIFEFASKYAAQNQSLAQDYPSFLKSFELTSEMISDFKKLVLNKGIQFAETEWQQNIDFIRMRIKGEIARYFWNSERYYEVLFNDDKQIQDVTAYFKESSRLTSGF